MPRPSNELLAQEARHREEGAKACRMCGQVLALSDFGKLARSRDGLQALCKSCINKRNREWVSSLPPERAKRHRKLKQNSKKANPATQKRLNEIAKAKRYNLSVEEYNHLMSMGCNICGAPAKAMDHCHASGNTRGPLCDPCNMGLGHFKDDPEIMAAAIFYLLYHKPATL